MTRFKPDAEFLAKAAELKAACGPSNEKAHCPEALTLRAEYMRMLRTKCREQGAISPP